ncbi:MAG: nucleotide sugar dehydrogenase [Hydrogenobaculum sp.]
MINIEDFLNKKESICVVGLGYVGLPLAVAFARHFNVIGFDINQIRINELKLGIDRTKETTPEELLNSNILFTANEEYIKKCKFIIITVPTPIDKHKVPDLKPIFSASTIVGRNLQKDSIVVYESTVYPGLTEEECVPILEKESKLKWKKDFFVGYSPERINPGDKIHRFENIVKVVSGDSEYSLNIISEIYSKVVKAGIFKAKSIKVAEAAKVIENTQRDINIALMNELSMIFHKMGIDTKDVLEAAATKWNFLKFEPGLVGGHCISVDPYYLTFKAQELGHHPEVILSGRRVNDNMPNFVVQNVLKLLIKAKKQIESSKIIIFGLSFKENIPDIRNSKVVDIYNELKDFGIDTYIYDPYVYKDEVFKEYGIELLQDPYEKAPYDAVIVAVKHNAFGEYDIRFYENITKSPKILVDIKSLYNKDIFLKNGFLYWSL